MVVSEVNQQKSDQNGSESKMESTDLFDLTYVIRG